MKTLPTKYEIRTNGIVYAEFTPCADADACEFQQHVIKEFTAYRSRRGQSAKLFSVNMTEMEVRHIAVCIACAEAVTFAGGEAPICKVCKTRGGMVTFARLKPVANADDTKGKADTAAEAMEEAYTPDTTAAGNQPPALNAEPAPPNTTENSAAGNLTLSPEAAKLLFTLLTMDGAGVDLRRARNDLELKYGPLVFANAFLFVNSHCPSEVNIKEEPRRSYEIRDPQNRTVQTVTIPQDAPVVTQSAATDDDDDEEENQPGKPPIKLATIANEISLTSTSKMEKSKYSGERHDDYAEVSAGIKQGRKWQWKHHYAEEWTTPINRREPAWDNRFRYRLEQEDVPQLTPIPKAEDEPSRPEHPDKAAMTPYLERGARWEYRSSRETRWRKSTLPKPSWYHGNCYRIAEGEIERLAAIVAAEAEAYNAKKEALLTAEKEQEAAKARVKAAEDNEKTAAQIIAAPLNTIFVCNDSTAVWAIAQRVTRLDIDVVTASLYASEQDLLRVLDRGRPIRVDHRVSLPYCTRDAIILLTGKAELEAAKRTKEGAPAPATIPNDMDALRVSATAINSLLSVAGRDPEADDGVIAIYELARQASAMLERVLN